MEEEEEEVVVVVSSLVFQFFNPIVKIKIPSV
jgi:hypothetical protein